MNTSKNLSTLNTRFDKRFGHEYFKRIPTQPGVFWMNDSRRQLLLLGHSNNLKYKLLLLRSYLLHSTPHTEFEIINQIHEIHWTHCDSTEASLRLIEELKEKFNTAYKIESSDTESFYYIHFQSFKSHIQLQITKEPQVDSYTFGAFKGKNQTLSVYSSLLRWLRFYYNGGSAMQWPSPFNKQLMPTKWRLKKFGAVKNTSELDKQIINFFTGKSRNLLLSFTERLELERDQLDKFTRLWLHKDLSRLDRFFRTSITRNKNIIQCLNLSNTYVEPEWADSLRIRPSTFK
ncbi:MAG: hypothetical protein KDD58_10155 [Bdellovibrionales bacterium]|nr:hypothetical protein [Bdellovibrionales bacterium]